MAEATDAKVNPKLEIAHVLTMDIVEYSKLLITEQSKIMAQLTRLVRETARFRQAEAEDKLLRLPTGDGMVLVFFDDPEAPIECASEISAAIKNRRDIPLRNVDARPCDIGSIININYLIQRSTVNSHPQRNVATIFDCRTNFRSAFDRCFRVVEKNKYHPIASWQSQQFVFSLSLAKSRSLPDKPSQLRHDLALLCD